MLQVDADLGLLDGARDQIHVQGTDGFNNIGVRPFLETVRVEGLDPVIRIENARPADDRLTVFGRGGVDFITADRSVGERIALTLDGGAGTDVLDGSDAADTLRGGPDADVITGGKGNDIVDMGDGDDRFTRTVADGIDRVEGGAGFDQLSASGTESDDFIEVQGLLARTRLLYGFAGSADMGGIEYISHEPVRRHRQRHRPRPGRHRDHEGRRAAEHRRPARGHPDRDRHPGAGLDQGRLQRRRPTRSAGSRRRST